MNVVVPSYQRTIAFPNRAAASEEPDPLKELEELEAILGHPIDQEDPVDHAPVDKGRESESVEQSEGGFGLGALAKKYGGLTGGGILGGIAGVVAVGSIAGWWLPVVAGVAAGVGAARVAHNMGAGKKAMLTAGVTAGLATAAASFTALKLAGFALGAVGGGAAGKFATQLFTGE